MRLPVCDCRGKGLLEGARPPALSNKPMGALRGTVFRLGVFGEENAWQRMLKVLIDISESGATEFMSKS